MLKRECRLWVMGVALGVGPVLWATQARRTLAAATHPTTTAPQHQDCASCHTPHGAVAGSAPLQSMPDDACLACHQGTTPVPVRALAARGEGGERPGAPIARASWGSSHGLGGPQARGSSYKRVVWVGSRRIVLKVGCMGCHDPHGKGVGKLKALAFDTRGRFLDIKPMFTAQICFGCHAGPDAAPLPFLEADVGALFARKGGSSHGAGQAAADRPDLPSLRSQLFKGKLDCTACHDNPDATGLRGPHSSPFPYLLKAAYGREGDVARVGDRSNELCYLCHDRYSIESNRSFPLHREHLSGFTSTGPSGTGAKPGGVGSRLSLPMGFRLGRVGNAGAPGPLFSGFGEPTACATCHDPHGSPRNPALIQFDKSVVTRSSVGSVDFYRSGLGHGTCTLTCHGYDHMQTRY